MPYYRRGIAGCQPPVRNFAESSRGARFLTARSGFSYKVFRKFSAPLPGLLRNPTKAETGAELRIRQAPGQEKPLHRRFTAGTGASERGYEKSIATPHRMRRNGWPAALGLLPGGQWACGVYLKEWLFLSNLQAGRQPLSQLLIKKVYTPILKSP